LGYRFRISRFTFTSSKFSSWSRCSSEKMLVANKPIIEKTLVGGIAVRTENGIRLATFEPQYVKMLWCT